MTEQLYDMAIQAFQDDRTDTPTPPSPPSSYRPPQDKIAPPVVHPAPYGHPPGREELKALVDRGLTDAQIADLYHRSRAWAKSLRRRYLIPGHSKGMGMRRRGFTMRHERRDQRHDRAAEQAVVSMFRDEPLRPPSMDGLDDECRRWLENGGQIKRIEPKAWPSSPAPVRPRLSLDSF